MLALLVTLLIGISLSAGAEADGNAALPEPPSAPGHTSTSENVVPIKITTWTHDESQLAMLGRFVDEFAATKGIQIKATFETIDFQDYSSKLMMELSGEDAPDLYWVLETAATAFIASGNLAVLNDALADYHPEDFAESALELWQDRGKLYALPFSTSPFILLYNADLFERAGVRTPDELAAEGRWTWEEFRKISKQIKDVTGVYGFQTVDGGGYTTHTLQTLLPIIRSYGGDAWNDKGKVLIDTDESIAAVQLFHDMLYVDGSVVPPEDGSSFYDGTAAMTVGQISRVSNLDKVEWKWGMTVLPGNVSVIGQAALGVFSRSKNVKLAAELAAYMTGESCAARVAGIWPPARYSVLKSEAFLTSNKRISAEQMSSAVAAAIASGRVLPSHALYPHIAAEAKAAYDKLWNASADVAAIMHEVGKVYRCYIW